MRVSPVVALAALSGSGVIFGLAIGGQYRGLTWPFAAIGAGAGFVMWLLVLPKMTVTTAPPVHGFGEYVAELLRPYGGRVERGNDGVLDVASPNWTGTIRGADGEVRIELKCPHLKFKWLNAGDGFPRPRHVDPRKVVPPVTTIKAVGGWSLETDYAETDTRVFLDDETGRQFRNLIALNYGVSTGFGLRDELIRVTKSCGTSDPRTVVHAIRLALRLVDRAIATLGRAEGVVVVDVATGAGRCEVCACPLDVDIVACVKCSSRHHAECWSYAGRCSTFGCGGTEAAPVPKP